MSARVQDLERWTQERCVKFVDECLNGGLSIRITHTLRTMDEQRHLYAQGRTFAGAVVTNAPPGESPHNWGMAFDICFEGKTLDECYPAASDPRWAQVAGIGEALGLAWGGRWKSLKDLPHFERPDWRLARGVVTA